VAVGGVAAVVRQPARHPEPLGGLAHEVVVVAAAARAVVLLFSLDQFQRLLSNCRQQFAA
jgi:hypothetical protein